MFSFFSVIHRKIKIIVKSWPKTDPKPQENKNKNKSCPKEKNSTHGKSELAAASGEYWDVKTHMREIFEALHSKKKKILKIL